MGDPATFPTRGDEEAHDEPFGLSWPGKRAAARLAEEPPTSRLVARREQSVRFGETGNRFIEGENLEVLKLLAGEFAGRVNLIYIDPPYNTGNSFIFADRYAESGSHGQGERRGTRVGRRVDAHASGAQRQSRRHARWLSMLYPRLLVAKKLLREDGALCMSIGEDEIHHARMLLDEVFGGGNFRNTLAVRRYDKNLSRQFLASGLPSLAVGFEYVLIYARSPAFTMRAVYREASARRRERGYWKGFWNAADRPTMRYELLGVKPEAGQWKWQESVARAAVANYAEYLASYAETMSLEEYWVATGRTKRFLRRNPNGKGRNLGVEHWIAPSSGILRTSNWTDLLASESLASLGLPFDNPKSVRLMEQVLRLCSPSDALVLDFFAGSATTAHAALNLNAREGARRRFILAQSAEPTGRDDLPTIAEIGKERIRRALDLPNLLPPSLGGKGPHGDDSSRVQRGTRAKWDAKGQGSRRGDLDTVVTGVGARPVSPGATIQTSLPYGWGFDVLRCEPSGRSCTT